MLKDCIPSEFAKVKQIEEMFEAIQPEIDDLESAIESWINELNILSCKDTIARYENDFEVRPSAELTLEQRRASVFAKKNSRLKPTITNLENMLKQILSADRVLITEEKCRFNVYVGTAELIENLDIAKSWFKDIRPAHYEFKFINEVAREYDIQVFIGIRIFKRKIVNVEVK